MAQNEKLRPKQELQTSPAELETARYEQQEKIREKLEREKDTPEHSAEDARQEALEAAKSVEKQERKEKSPTKERAPRGPLSKKQREASFKQTMSQVQQEMSAPSRVFSKVIHNKSVEKVSNVVGATIARPNAILAGSLTAFIFTLSVFLIARHYGYPLSGTESIASFAIGWMAGLLFDYLRLEFTGGRS